MKVSEVLGKSIDYMHTHGWYASKNPQSTRGGSCAAVTIAKAVECNTPAMVAGFTVLLTVLGLEKEHVGDGWVSPQPIYNWNDDPSQTPENVLHTLELAKLHAEEMEKQEQLQGEMAEALVRV
jgi:hypothetical protein